LKQFMISGTAHNYGRFVTPITQYISKDLVTIIGPNIKVESNSTDNLIVSPNRINVKIEMIQGIGDVGVSLSS
ncbi:hypothetical protein ACT4UL_18865, partial [Bacillus sp. HC-TM]